MDKPSFKGNTNTKMITKGLNERDHNKTRLYPYLHLFNRRNSCSCSTKYPADERIEESIKNNRVQLYASR